VLCEYGIMADEMRNTWLARTERTLTSVLPVSEKRTGECISCGACCKLPNVCPFLRYKPDGQSYCDIYAIRPLNCRKYPRTESEFITADTCGFRFE
jgi:Fe-S-cluster containining protein